MYFKVCPYIASAWTPRIKFSSQLCHRHLSAFPQASNVQSTDGTNVCYPLNNGVNCSARKAVVLYQWPGDKKSLKVLKHWQLGPGKLRSLLPSQGTQTWLVQSCQPGLADPAWEGSWWSQEVSSKPNNSVIISISELLNFSSFLGKKTPPHKTMCFLLRSSVISSSWSRCFLSKFYENSKLFPLLFKNTIMFLCNVIRNIMSYNRKQSQKEKSLNESL